MGFDVELVNSSAKKDANMCPHCRLILEEPYQTDEGVRLCKTCLQEIKSKPEGTCKCCGLTVADGQYYADKAAQREVNVLLVLCRYKQFNCPWQGKLLDYKAHVASCDFAGVSCPNTGCDVMVLASALEKHLKECDHRIVKCVHCGDEMVAKNLESHHSSECTMHPVMCERCQENIPHRHMLNDHLLHSCRIEECFVCSALVERSSSRNVSSDIASTAAVDEGPSATKLPQTPTTEGTKKPAPRTDSRKQKQSRKTEKSDDIVIGEPTAGDEENGKYHLSQPLTVFRHVQTLASRHGQLQTEFKTFTQSTETRFNEISGTHHTSEDTLIQDTVRSMEEKLQRMSEEVEREKRHHREMEDRMEQLRRQLETAERRAKDALEKTERNGREIESVRQSVKTGVGGAVVKSGRSGKGGGWDVGGMNVEERLMMLEQRTEQQERETSTLKVNVSELELQLQASLASTHNGSFLWRIPEVARRRRDAIDERITSIYSPPFYTGRNGYKMCIRAYLNGDGIGYKTHFSVFFVLMRGEFDPLLKWPFEYKVSLILVDQEHRKHIVQTFKPTAESSSFKRPHSDMNVASGCPQFSKLSVLDDESYTKDDVMYLKCIIDTSRIFHP